MTGHTTGKDKGVPLRRIRSNSWHTRETVNGPDSSSWLLWGHLREEKG
jgi:hypothetical protein